MFGQGAVSGIVDWHDNEIRALSRVRRKRLGSPSALVVPMAGGPGPQADSASAEETGSRNVFRR